MLESWADWAMKKPGPDRTDRTSERFDKIALYTCYVSREILKEAISRHRARAKETGMGYGSWGWDVEVFLPEDLVPYLKPSSVKVYSAGDIKEEKNKHRTQTQRKNTTLEWAESLKNNPAAIFYARVYNWLGNLSLKDPQKFEDLKRHIHPEKKTLLEHGVPSYYDMNQEILPKLRSLFLKGVRQNGKYLELPIRQLEDRSAYQELQGSIVSALAPYGFV